MSKVSLRYATKIAQPMLAIVLGLVTLNGCSEEKKPTPPRTFTVTASGSHVTLSPTGAVTLQEGATQAFTVTADTDYTLLTTVGGDCPAGTWDGATYTTGAIASDCALSFSAAINTFQVTPSGDHVTFTPGSVQTIEASKKASFTVTAATGYTRSAVVLGTCPQGTWENDRYTTGAITAVCSVKFSATLNTYAVTTSGDHLTIAPSGVQTVNHGETLALTVTAETGYTLSTAVGGTCAAGSWNLSVYTTGAITGACTVEFSATLNSYLVTSSGTNLTIDPAGAQTVNHGSTLALKVTPDTGYTVSETVTGTCPAGSWQDDTYTTGVITELCTVEFSATLNTYTVTTSGTHVTISPSGDQTVNHGDSLALTVAADVGYTLSTTVGGTCAAGSWNAGVYTTGVVTAPCTVEFGATLNTYAVSASGTDVTIDPTGDQQVSHGSPVSFTVTAAAHHTLSNTVTGTCAAGFWNGNVYTTGAITAPCAVAFSAPLTTYQVTSSGSNVSVSPSSAQTVSWGNTLALTVTGNTGYDVSTTVGGTCAAGSWNGSVYTTGAITGACTVTFSGTLKSYNVTSSGTNVTVSPSGARTVNHGSTLSYTVTPATNYNRSNTVTGTCPAGSWSGNTYTTGAITGACTVGFSATLKTYQVTSYGLKLVLNPSTVQTVNHGSTIAFSVQPESGYTRKNTVGGTCPAGSWSSNTYTTGAITADCSISFSVNVVYLYPGSAYLGKDIGNRAAASTKCQQAAAGVPALACSHYVPLLAYAAAGVTDLTNAPWSLPSNQRLIGKNGNIVANDWNSLLNVTTGLGPSLLNAGVLPSAGDRGWSGLQHGGGFDGYNCSDWSSGAGFGDKVNAVNDSWDATTSSDCTNTSNTLLCMCWAD